MPSAPSPSPHPRTTPADAAGRQQPVRSPGAPEPERRPASLTLRRAPRISVFIILGTVLGALAGIVAGLLGAGSAAYTDAQVVGFMMCLFAVPGAAVGAIAALLLDRRSLRRAQEVQATAESARVAE